MLNPISLDEQETPQPARSSIDNGASPAELCQDHPQSHPTPRRESDSDVSDEVNPCFLTRLAGRKHFMAVQLL